MRSLKLLATVLLLTTLSWADSQVRIVRLSVVDGPVQLDRNTGEGFERAIMNMPIAQGMQLWTRGDSRAEVEFEEGNTIRLSPETKIEFTTLVLRSDGSRSTLIRIDSGRAYVDYSKKSGEDFRVQVGDKQIALTDSVHFRADVADGRAELAVISGELNASPDLRVKKNNTAVLDLASGSFQLAKGITPVLEDDWDQYRTDYHDKYAKSAYKGATYYGRSDLNYYGGWFDSPFGSCWRPYGFDASWSPYSAGAWAYYPGYGYTFVSAYPWGWQPFHYGAWNYAGSAGWCWTPNRNFYGYGYAPLYYGRTTYVPVQPPTRPKPPTRVGGGPIRPWEGGGVGRGLIPVGNVDSTTWHARNPGIRPWMGDPHHHYAGGETHVGGGSVVAGGGVATGGTGVTATSRSAAVANGRAVPMPRDYKGRVVNPDDSRAFRDAQRQQQREIQREVQREQGRMDHEIQRSGGGFDRGGNSGNFNRGGGNGGGAPASSPSSAPARMSAPAPQMSAPVHSAPSGGGGERPSHNAPVPK